MPSYPVPRSNLVGCAPRALESAPSSCSVLDDPGLCARCPWVRWAALVPLRSVPFALGLRLLHFFLVHLFPGPEATLLPGPPWRVIPEAFASLAPPVRPSLSAPDDPVLGHPIASPGHSGPVGRLLVAVPDIPPCPRPSGWPSRWRLPLRLPALSRTLLSKAFCLPFLPYSPIPQLAPSLPLLHAGRPLRPPWHVCRHLCLR